MTLKEKFKQWLDTNPRKEIREAQLEVIADKYAIGFAQYLIEQPLSKELLKELLEIYKKEL
jgi:hypothetical protein